MYVGTKQLINDNPWGGGGVYENSHIKLTLCPHIISAILGLVLGGSASIYATRNEGHSLRIYSSLADQLWMKYMYCLFGFMCNRGVVETVSTGTLKSGLIKQYIQLLLVTIQHYDLGVLYSRIYKPGTDKYLAYKFIPTDIASWFDVITLAYFVMAAGTWHASGLVLNLGSYTQVERDIFQAMLLSNFGIATTQQSRLYVKAKDKAKLLGMIKPYLHSSRLSLFTKSPKS